MGLDGVGVVMEVEKDFGIKIADAEAEKVRVVANLWELIVARLLQEPDALPDRLSGLWSTGP